MQVVNATHRLNSGGNEKDPLVLELLELDGRIPVPEQWILDIAASNLIIRKLIIYGNGDDTSLKTWADTMLNGCIIRGNNVQIDLLIMNGLHVGVDLSGNNIVISEITADRISGDVVQGKGSFCQVHKLECIDLLEVLPYELYHTDVIHWRNGGRNIILKNISVKTTESNNWARKNYQGLTFTDGCYERCFIENAVMPGVSEHSGVQFSEAHSCTVSTIRGGGAIRFRSLNGVASTGCIATDVDGYIENTKVENTMTKKMFDPKTEYPNVKLYPGLRNNNPTNLIRTPIRWDGEAEESDLLPYQEHDKRFEVFLHPIKGMRAGMINAIGYQDGSAATKYKKFKNLNQIIKLWSATDQNSYLAYMCDWMGKSPNETISLRDYETAFRFLTGLIMYENDRQQPYPDEMINDALAGAGVRMPGEPKPVDRPTKVSKEIITGAATVAGGGTGVVAGISGDDTPTAPVDGHPVTGSDVAQNTGNGILETISSMSWPDLIQTGAGIVVIVAAVLWLYDRHITRQLGQR